MHTRLRLIPLVLGLTLFALADTGHTEDVSGKCYDPVTGKMSEHIELGGRHCNTDGNCFDNSKRKCYSETYVCAQNACGKGACQALSGRNNRAIGTCSMQGYTGYCDTCPLYSKVICGDIDVYQSINDAGCDGFRCSSFVITNAQCYDPFTP